MRVSGLRLVAGVLVVTCARLASAAAPTAEQIAQLCTSAEGPAHCGRLIEATQLKALPNLARRDGDTLTISLFPSGQRSFVDTVSINTEKNYALFDYWSSVNAVVLLVSAGDDMSFVILQRATGQVTQIPAEPFLSPDRQRVVVADFCATCTNELSVWRIGRDGIRKELAWKPQPAWRDVTVQWKDADTLLLRHTTVSGAEAQTQERKLAARDWQRP